MKNIFKITLYGCLSAVSFVLLAGAGLWLYEAWEYRLPPEQRVRQQFEDHRADYIRFVTFLRNDRSAKYIGSGGMVDIDGINERLVPEYRDLIRKIGAKFVIVREDGSMEFALWGNGGTVMDDSYMGVRYFPKDHSMDAMGWKQIVVTSLASAKLPQEHEAVATGLYVVSIEPEWFIYRLEIQE
jgi:hypothetical protein